MNKQKQYRAGTRLAIIALGLPLSAQAFVDERSVPKLPDPPALVVTERVQAPAPAPAPALASTNQVAPPIQTGVRGDLSSAVWQAAYPGPYGRMALADALIAQIVPAVGKAISLSGAPELLSQFVVVPQGLNRVDTLNHVANALQIGVELHGTTVTLIRAGQAPVAPSVRSQPTQESVTATSALAVTIVESNSGAQKKSWNIPIGTMLSVAMRQWAEKWGWTLIWNADVDYRIAAPIHIQADFIEGVTQVLDAYRRSDRPLWGDWQEQQKILVVREPDAL